MKIKLGSTTLNYVEPVSIIGRDIVCEVVDSPISFESPVLVSSQDQLDIWFGKDNFPEYDYLSELLRKNISLLLYKPVRTTENDKVSEGYYFLKDLTPQTEKVAKVLCKSDDLPGNFNFNNYSLTKVDPEPVGDEEENIKYYKVISPTGQYYDVDNDISYSLYRVKRGDSEEESVQYLPCDLDDVKENLSLKNRDRISISLDGKYSYYNIPEEPESSENDSSDSSEGPISIDNIDVLQDGLFNDTITCGIKLGIRGGVNLDDLSCKLVDSYTDDNQQLHTNWASHYFAVLAAEKENIEYYIFEPSPSSLASMGNYHVYPGNDSFTKCEKLISNSKTFFLSVVSSAGNGNIELETSVSGENIVISPNIRFDSFIPFRGLCNMPSWFSYENDIEYAQERIYNDYIKDIKEKKRELYRFESKTLGSCSDVDGGDIQVTIEKLGFLEDTYRVSITRFSYSEEFIGSMLGGPGIERLDNRISRESRLVRFKILQESEPKGGWRTGTWTLRGAVVEPTDKCDYSYSLEKMSNLDYQVDFFLFPKKTVSDSLILEATKKMNCQALITNTNSNLKSNIGRSDSDSDDESENRDPENRLMYFYGNFLFGLDTIRPGYYLFLDNLLSDTSYLPNSGDTLYPVDYGERENPTDTDYSKEENSNELEKYRSNFLTYDGYHYYYDRYFSGKNYTTTPLVRFVIGKVTREIEKIKWTLVGSKIGSVEIRNTLERVLENIKNRFSIIRSIVLSNFEVTYRENKVEARITTQLSDLIPSDVSFDIVINYSKKV